MRPYLPSSFLRFNATVRLPAEYSAEKIMAITDEVISVLGLWDVRHQIIGDETTRGYVITHTRHFSKNNVVI